MASKKKTAVTNYISIMFAAAFFLMMMTYLMEQREVADSLQGIRSSVSSMQSMDQLYQEKLELMEEIQDLLTQVHDLEADQSSDQQERKELEESIAVLAENLVQSEEKYTALLGLWMLEQDPENTELLESINSEFLEEDMQERLKEIKGDE
ncbi:MAG: hypothetical protein R3Y63_02050 [Eubacteriales bacterium]